MSNLKSLKNPQSVKEGRRFRASEVVACDHRHKETLSGCFCKMIFMKSVGKTGLRLIGVMMTLQAERSN